MTRNHPSTQRTRWSLGLLTASLLGLAGCGAATQSDTSSGPSGATAVVSSQTGTASPAPVGSGSAANTGSAGSVVTSGALDYEDSQFGIFAAFTAKEYSYFNTQMGFDSDDYWSWAEDHLAKLGAHWTRSNLQLLWDLVEPTVGGTRDWDAMEGESMLKRLYSGTNQVHWLGVFHEGGTGASAPATPGGKAGLRNPLDQPDEYKAFVQAAVERYDGDGVGDVSSGVRVRYWQAGNEVPQWENSGRTADEYVAWVRLLREATRAADSESKLVLIAPTDGRAVDAFLRDVITQLAGEDAFEAIDVHHWGDADQWAMTAVPAYRSHLDSLGLTEVQIWSSEHGTWQGSPARGPSQTEEEQARSLVKRYVYNLNNGLDKLLWNNLMEWDEFAGVDDIMFNSMGLVTDGQGPGEDPARFATERVAYWAYKTLAGRIDTHQARPLGAVSQATVSGQTYAFAYERLSDGQRFTLLWAEGGSVSVDLSVGQPRVHVTNLITDRYGDVLEEYDAYALNGQVTLTLGSDPVLVEEN